MANSLEQFVTNVRSAWGPLTSELAATVRGQIERLAQTSLDETWLAELIEAGPANQELYRDPEHGFVLLAHTEKEGLYRAPHDHGRAWVVYAVQHGAIDMGGYAHLTDGKGGRLVKRDATLVRAGMAQVYLPGDIHDTRCVTDNALLFRFTERDLKVEDKRDHRITRYVERNGLWTVAAP